MHERLIRILGTAIPRESRLCILAEKNGAFEALEVGESVIDPKLYCIADGNTAGLRPAGRIANRNTAITESEFSALVTGGTRIRRGFDPIDAVRSAASGGWLESQVRKVRDALTLDRRA